MHGAFDTTKAKKELNEADSLSEPFGRNALKDFFRKYSY